MTGSGWSPQQPDSGPRTEGVKSGVVWWVVASVAVVVSVALVAWLLVTSPTAVPPIPPPASSTAPASVSPSSAESSVTVPSSETVPEPSVSAFDYGDFPPVYELKDLSNPNFPDQLGEFELDELNEDGLEMVIADYRKNPGPGLLDSWWLTGRSFYRTSVEGLSNPEFHGRALCGSPATYPDQVECVMAGKNETLTVGSFTDTVTISELSALTETLYDAL